MRKFFFAPVALAILTAGPTLAAELPISVQQPAMTLVFSWTGWYVGAFVGGAPGGNSQTEVVSYPMSGSFIGGVTAGFNYQIPGSAIVFGFETEFGALRLKGSSSFAPVSSFTSAPNLVASATIGPWYNATTGRIGWAWDRLMIYGKGGFAASTIESTLDPVGGTGKRDVLGWAWGAGFEYVFAPKWSVKAEYLGLGLNHGVGVCAGVAPGASGAGSTFCTNTTTQPVHTAKVGINYLFNVGPVYERY
jgi:outer membrane immunogenic protein